MDSIFFYHHLKQTAAVEPVFYRSVIWETCLRKIIFTDQHEIKNTCFLKNESALIFLIELLCGLHSKIIGETEIFGQFKKFIESTEAKKVNFLNNPQLIQFLLSDVKYIRETHIQKIGVNSYGSLIRKICQKEKYISKNISVIGYGQIAQKIIPWMSQDSNIQIHVRNLDKYKDVKIKYSLTEISIALLQPTVIIAAALPLDELKKLFLQNPQVKKVIDCRGLSSANESVRHLNLMNVDIIELSDLFDSLQKQQNSIKNKIPEIKKEIQDRVDAFMLKLQHRPLGWEDLCG